MMTLDAIRDAFLPRPGVEEDVKWETNWCLMVGGKMFVLVDLDPRSPGRVTIPTAPEERATLLDRRGVLPAPYLARAGWVTLEPNAMPIAEMLEWVEQAHAIIAAKLSGKRRRELGIDGDRDD